MAGLIWENYLHGRKKSVWFTASPGTCLSTLYFYMSCLYVGLGRWWL